MLTNDKYPKHTLIYDYDEIYGYAREPVIRRMPDGSLICLSLSGDETEPRPGNVVLLLRSADDGASWSEPEVLFSHSCRGCWATEIFTEGDLPMIVVHTYLGDSTTYREIQTFRSYSHDGGKTWTEPVSFPSGLDNVSIRQGIVMSNGEWLFPLYWQPTSKGFDWVKHPVSGWSMFRSGAAISPDRGKSYFRTGEIAMNDGCAWEPNAVELEDGHIVMLTRNEKISTLGRTDSFDYGRTWSQTVPSPFENPGTKLSLLKVEGKIVLLNNFNPTFKVRKNLELWVSSDHMQTWEKKIQLANPDERLFYPHAYADHQQRILYITCENAHQHYLIKLPYDQFL